jgi:putative tryptophan/tyrosine transport system substrate-binding protein
MRTLRRQVLAILLTLTATVATLSAVAARAEGPARVGFIWLGARGSFEGLDGLRQGLQDGGYTLGRDLMLEERYADGHPEGLADLVTELLALKVDVLVTPGSQTATVAKNLAPNVPIVFVSGDPIAAGLAASLAHPGGNLTGMSLLSGDYSAKWLELLKEAVPKLHRVAVLWNPDNRGIARELEPMPAEARALDLDLAALCARPQEIDGTLASVRNTKPDGLVVTDDPFLISITPRLISFAEDAHLPVIYGYGGYGQQGALMSYSTNLFAINRRAASYVDRIIKGARPSDLPIEQATEVSLRINLKTAKALGLTIPPSLLARADEVIE